MSILLINTPYQAEVVGDPYEIEPHHYHHTVVIEPQNFCGEVMVQVTLRLEPTETDWFSIPLGGAQSWVVDEPTSKAVSFNFEGKFKHVRAKVLRTDSVFETVRDVNLSRGKISRIVHKSV